MSDLPIEALLANHRVHIPEAPPVLNLPSHDNAVSPPIAAPSEEHVAAVDGAFLRERQEQETLAGLIGLRLSVLLMHDLAKDALPTGDDEEQPNARPRDDEPQPAE